MIPMFGFQERAKQDLIRDPFHALFMDPGMGKTRIVLEAFVEMKESLDVDKLLVFAPVRVCTMTWPDEAAKWAPGLSVEYLGDPGAMERDADIYCINPERANQLFGKRGTVIGPRGGKKEGWIAGPWASWKKRPDMLAVDELSRWKRASGSRHEALYRYLDDFGRRVGMTGTPAPNGLEDLHGQMLLIDGGRSLDHRIGAYRRRYFDRIDVEHDKHGHTHPEYVLKPGYQRWIYEAIGPRVTSLRAADYLDLPPLIQRDIEVELSKRSRADVEHLIKHSTVVLENGMELYSEQSAGSRVRQLINGIVYDVDPLSPKKRPTTWKVVHTEKLDALAGLVAEIQQPVLIAYEHKCEREEIFKYLRKTGIRVARAGGGVPKAEVDAALRDWNAGKLDALVMHPAAHGLNLQTGGNHLIWFGPPWDLELYLQFNGRLQRTGQTADRVLCYHLVSRGTLDVRVSRVLCQKNVTQDMLFMALREED